MEKAFRNLFKKNTGFPKFKKKKNQNVKAYFPKNNKTDWIIKRHRVKIPTLGWIRLKEYGHIPINSIIKSGTVSQKANRYYVSILVEEDNPIYNKSPKEVIGIDLGLKEFAICSNGNKFKNINKTSTIKKTRNRTKKTIKEI